MTFMEKEINEQPDVLALLLDKSLSKAEELCKEIKKRNINFVYIAGRGTSDNAGVYIKYILETYAKMPVALAAPSVITLYHGKPDLKDCLVIGISQSGEALDVLEVIKLANEQGAVTLSITNYDESPLAKLAAYHFNCFAGEEKSVAATKTFTSEMFIGAIITAALSDNDELTRWIHEIPGKAKKYISEYVIDINAVNSLKDENECFVMARGMNYPIALEASLKIQETCYVRARAYSLSDFYHGPFAMLQDQTNVIMIAPEGESINDTLDMVQKLNAVGCKVISFTNNKMIKDCSTHNIEIYNDMNDFESPIINAIAIQRFALKLSLAKGLDPDHPRNLRKVTLTK
ncbi:MAG: SIS domain-containing protein [Clostridia bacterium]|nr:SIS domain-containing protein [Clostridia bacterium]